METVFIHGRLALADAAELIEHYGDRAATEAAARARRFRSDGNLARFCHWRQIERVVTALSSDEVTGSIH
ncbi:MAG TPA: hypothetical protein VF067_07930 [Sphingomicrobium sp.]